MSRMFALASLALIVALCLVLPGCRKDKKSQQEMDRAAGVQMTAPTSQPSLYERMGGEEKMRAIVDDYVAFTSLNPTVNFYRKGTSEEWKPTAEEARQVKQHMVEFFSLIAGHRQANYQGKSMVEVHKGMRITPQQFAASLDDLRQAMAKNNVPQDLQDEFMASVDQTRKAIVEVKQ